MSWIEAFHCVAGNGIDLRVDQTLGKLIHHSDENVHLTFDEQTIDVLVREAAVNRAGIRANAAKKTAGRWKPRLAVTARAVGETEIQRAAALHVVMNDELMPGMRDDDGGNA